MQVVSAEPDLNDVYIFVVTAQAGTFSAAARHLRIPTSTVSRSLTRLEQQLSTLLVYRNAKGFLLTDAGRRYLPSCRRALRILKQGQESLESYSSRPSGIIKVRCPVTMAREVFAPLLKEFFHRYPELRLEIEPYASEWDQEPPDDVDVFFKLRAPRDPLRRIRSFPGTARALFASRSYVRKLGAPSRPDDLSSHACIGSGTWKLVSGVKTAIPNIHFQIVTSDPVLHLNTTLEGLGIAILPLWMATQPDFRKKLVPVLPQWQPEPITLCALFFGPSRLTPKVQVLLDFLTEYLGTDRDPRVHGQSAADLFTDLGLKPTSGP